MSAKPSTGQLRVGIIGCGDLVQATHLPNLISMPDVRVTWICDLNSSTCDAIARRFASVRVIDDFRQVVHASDVDAIVLGTTQETRLPVIRSAVEAGKPVYCEKPMAGSLAEMLAIQRAVDQSGILFCVGHNRRSAPSMLRLHELFQRQRQDPSPCPWRFDRNSSLRPHWTEEDQAFMVIRINDDVLSWKAWAVDDEIMATGPMLFEMTHFTDLACLFMACRPVRVTSAGHLRMNQTVVIEFEDGSLASILQTGVGTFGYPKELYEVYCNGAALVLDHFVELRTAGMEGVPARTVFPLKEDRMPSVTDGGGIRDFYAKRRAAEVKTMAAGDPATFFQHEPVVDKGHKEHLGRFLQAVRDGGASPCSCDDAIVATRIAFAAIESLRLGTPVEV